MPAIHSYSGDKVYFVTGGEYTDTSFDTLASKPEVYGPFDNYEKAREVWWQGTCKQVDNCHHRLIIKTLKVNKEASRARLQVTL